MGPNVKLKCVLITVAVGLALVQGKSPGYMILAPNVFHVGLEETVAVTATAVTSPVKVKLFLQEFPNRRTNFSHIEGFFGSGKSGLLKIKVNPQDVPSQDTEYNQYVYLVAMCNDPQLVFYKEVKILLSYKDKIVLVQTDKPVYSPKQTVKLRVIPLDFNLRPSVDKVNIFIKNPQGILAQRWRNVSSQTGFITKALHLGDHSLIGNWTIAITYGYLNSQNKTVKFEVKEYVLPRFSLRIFGPSYILPSAKRISIAIVAKYTYGKPVVGSVITRLTLTGKGQAEIKFFVNSSKLYDGKVQLKIDTNLLKNHVLRPWFPDGRRLRIDADVIEQATGARESAVDSSIYFVKTPFHLSYENTAMYFKPAMPYGIKIDVNYPNKRPASHLPVQISAKGTSDTGQPVDVMQKVNDRVRKYMKGNTDGQGRVEFILDVPRSVKDIEVEVKTKDVRLGKANAAIKFEARAYNSPSKRYLHIRPQHPKSVVGVVSMWDVFQNGNISALTFMVLSRGRILLQVLTRPKDGVNVVSTFTFIVTKEMSPSCRVLAYYVTKDNEVVADSAVLEVEERFPNKVRFASPGKQAKEENPGMDYVIEVESTPGSRVGLLGVDESVYLIRNKNRLTKKKVFKDVKNLDLGCGVGPGRNNQDVFKNSGLMVITNSMDTTRERTSFGCSAAETKNRRKRAISDQEKATCCRNGKLPSRASCAIRARFMSLNSAISLECVEAFLNCCRIQWNEKAPVVDKRQRQFFEENNGFFGGDEDDIQSEQVRKYFPETWIFDEETTGSDGRMLLPVTLPDTITTWVLQAISISNTSGFAMTLPSRLATFKKFFVTLSLPYSVQRGEQLSIVATIFNYGEETSHFEVRLSGSREFCSTETPGDKSKPIALSVKANDAKSVTFPIVPIQLGNIPIRVSAARKIFGFDEAVGSDVVQRDLLVVPEGVQRRFVHSLVLDPQGVLRDEKPTNHNASTPAPTLRSERIVQDGQQINAVMLAVPRRAIPGSIQASIYLTGNLIGPVVTNLIKGGLENILRMPMGCGEQNMIYLAPNVYVLEYLTNTKQVTADVEARAYRFIQQGYQQELGFRRKDRSFSAFGETRPGSTWLTAFVAKVFCAARRFDGVAIDDNLVCDSVHWLLSNQRMDGAFPEVHDVVHKSLLGGVHGDVAMTAFVLTALLECKCVSQNSEVNIRRAVRYLESELASLDKAHVLALTTYSLALAKSTASSKANQRLFQISSFDKDQNTRHWDIGGPALNVETAGYALLSQLHLGRLKHGGPIVKWLTEQRNAEGGFISTQDTCVALQALAKYSEKTAGAQLDLRVSITTERDAFWRRTFQVERKNALVLRKVDITPFLGGELFIDSLGTGVGQMQIEIVHNVPSSKNETCLFDLRVSVKEEFDEDKVSDDGLFIVGRTTRRTKRGIRSRRKRKSKKKCKRRKRNRRHCRKTKSRKGSKTSKRKRQQKKSKKQTKKKKNEKKKEKIQKTQARAPDSLFIEVCTRYRKPGKSGMAIMDIGIFTGFEPDEKSLIELKKNVQPTVDRFEISDRSIVLYISEVFSTKEFCAHFKVNRVFGVGAIQPVPAKVYDYYEPGDSCTKFYSPDLRSELRLGICKGEQCKCTQDGCSSCSIESLDVDKLLKKACREHEFVFKGEVALVDEDGKGSQSWLNYFIIIQKVFKQLDTSKLKAGDHIEYKKRAGCRCPELRETGEFLFMGQERNGKQYVIDKNTFVVPWEGKTLDQRNTIAAFRARLKSGYTCPLQ